MSPRPDGFTLWELMMALVLAGIVLGIGVPSFMEFQRSNAMTTAANDLLSAVLAARSEAVKRQAPVMLCASPNPTAPAPDCGAGGGFIVFIDDDGDGMAGPTDGNGTHDDGEPLLLQRPPSGGAIRVWSDGRYVAFDANGLPYQPAAQPEPPASSYLYCDDRGNRAAAGGLSAARVVVIEPTGRAQVRQEIAQIEAAADTIAGAVCPSS
ncbi:MAG: GspH/FimT family pseudopilin [Gammaproteobacteria bacterium]|nr:GspH/FimT family pseudopilin [Gammaproteobacteria bacterium]